MSERGFTLIELMVVTAIVGILAAVAVASYQRYVTRAYVVEALTITGDVKVKVEDYFGYLGEFPESNADLNLPLPAEISSNAVAAVGVGAEGAIHVEFAADVNAELSGRILSMRPSIPEAGNANVVMWLCGYNDPAQGMRVFGANLTNVDTRSLPASCRARTAIEGG